MLDLPPEAVLANPPDELGEAACYRRRNGRLVAETESGVDFVFPSLGKLMLERLDQAEHEIATIEPAAP